MRFSRYYRLLSLLYENNKLGLLLRSIIKVDGVLDTLSAYILYVLFSHISIIIFTVKFQFL